MSESIATACARAAISRQRSASRGYPLVTVATRVAELGESDLSLEALNSCEIGASVPAEWFGLTAIVHALLGRRDEVSLLAHRVEQEDPGGLLGRASLAFAFEHVGELARTDTLLALLATSSNDYEIMYVGQIALAAGRIERATTLASRVSPVACPQLVGLRLGLARAHSAAGDVSGARAWFERAAEMLRPPKYFQPNVAVAQTAALLGETGRARDLAEAVDRSTRTRIARYGDPQHVDLAELYAALGEAVKVDEILAGFAAVHATVTCRGFASAARAYARLGRLARARTLVNQAEAKRGKRDDSGRLGLVRAYIELHEFARAIHHARHINDDMRTDALLEIARAATSHPVEMTPELEAEVAHLAKT